VTSQTTPDCPYCAHETAWSKFGSDHLHHAGGVLCTYTQFGPVARNQIDMQCQYASRYVTGVAGFPNLSEGLRFRNVSPANYHNIEIHRDDVAEFVKRVQDHRRARGQI